MDIKCALHRWVWCHFLCPAFLMQIDYVQNPYSTPLRTSLEEKLETYLLEQRVHEADANPEMEIL